MSSISQIASKLLSSRRGSAAGRTTGTSRPTGTTGNSTDAAVGRGVRGAISKLRR